MAKNFIASLPVMRPSLSETDREKEKGSIFSGNKQSKAERIDF